MKARKRIRVVTKTVEGGWAIRMIPNTLEALQAAVGGYIETVKLTTELTMVCNEEGIIQGLPFNERIFNFDIYGDFLIAKVWRDEFVTLSMEEASAVIRILEKKER